MIIPINKIDYAKYKRFFTFGCSFTNYHWPTWANILQQEMPTAYFLNTGLSGTGNLFIFNRIIETNLRYNFNENDLIIILWSTFCREDRYKGHFWSQVGNIFNQKEYSEEFVKKYCDPRGYLIRDLAIISGTKVYLNSLPSDAIMLYSVPFNHQNEDNKIDDILELHKDLINSSYTDLLTLEFNGEWSTGPTFYHPDFKIDFLDYHPFTGRYASYLQKLNFPLKDSTMKYVKDADLALENLKTLDEILKYFNFTRDTEIQNKWL